MRSSFQLLLAALLALAVASQATADPVPFAGQLSLQISTALDPVAVTATGIADVTSVDGHIATLIVPSSPFATTGVVVAVTDPAAFPIQGVQATAHNATGSFDGGVGGTLSGPMAILGFNKVCLFAPCSAPPPANVTVPVEVIGVGGTVTASMLVNVTVVGNPWTTGATEVGTITQAGFAHGPASATSSTAIGSGVVRLVTPVFVSTNIGASSVLPVFGFLDLHLGVPEPGTVALLGSAVAGLLLAGRTRR